MVISVDIKLDDNIQRMTRQIKRDLAKYPREAEAEFKSLTPVRSGNARRRTNLKGNDKIVADYAYAERLDDGYSHQAPRGMTVPFERWVRAKVKQIFGKK